MNEQINKLCFNLSIKYLSRYNVSSFKLQQYLQRKLFKIYYNELKENSEFKEEILASINTTVAKMITYKYINDDMYAQSKTKELIAQGKSKSTINYKLMQHGIEKNTINTTLELLHNDDINLYTALKYMKKKRLGCFSNKFLNIDILENEEQSIIGKNSIEKTDAKLLNKQIASMYRNGFTYDIIKKALSLSIEDAEKIINETSVY